MKTRIYNPEADYVEISTWWIDQGKALVPKQMLPKDGVVVVEEDTGTMLAFVGCYRVDNAPRLGFIGFPATNPKAPSRFKTHRALILAVKTASALMASWGVRYLMGWTDERAVEDAYKQIGMVPGERSSRDYIKLLGNP